jgi:hypothetical protein
MVDLEHDRWMRVKPIKSLPEMPNQLLKPVL